MWHVSRGMWHMVEGEDSLKISAPQLLWFWLHSVLKIHNRRIIELIEQWMTKVFVEQPQLHQVC